jgi:hypothetical protein
MSDATETGGLTVDGGSGRLIDLDRILRRQRRRMVLWTTLTVLLWVLAAGYLLGWLYSYLVFVHPGLNELLSGAEWPPERMRVTARALIDWLLALLWWPVLLVVAAGSTVWLLLASRRATLQQIRISLAEISAQLAALTHSDPTGGAPT